MLNTNPTLTALFMRPLARIDKSRQQWKHKAVSRATKNRDLSKVLRRERKRRQKAERERAELAKQLDSARRPATVNPAAQVVPIAEASSLRITCVLLAIVGVMPFRSVPRAVAIAQPGLSWIPHFTSVINWTLRVGLALLQGVGMSPEPWVAIVDMSIDVAVQKMFVVLRVPLSTLSRRGSALTLEETQCVGLEVGAQWNGEVVYEALRKIFSRAGAPVAILKDGGKDLTRGVELWRERNNSKRVPVIDDIGHVAANALKAQYAKCPAFVSFLKTITGAGKRLRQSELAFLIPPKARTKGRFQGITRLAEWARRILPLLGGRGRVEDQTIAGKLRRLVPGLGQHRYFLQCFTQTCDIVERFLEITKNHGINQNTYAQAKAELDNLPCRSKVRQRLTRWLDRHLRLQCRLGIGQLPIPVSSDVIESLMGKFKVVLARNPKAEFNRLVLTVPVLCGNTDDKFIAQALTQVTHRHLQSWMGVNVHATQGQYRHQFNAERLLPSMVPKTGTNLRGAGP